MQRQQNELVHFDKFVVYLAGFPRISDPQIIEKYMQEICPDADYQVVKSNTNHFRGFVLINFETYYASNLFMQKDHVFQGKVLEASVYNDEKTYIEKCLVTLREPKVIFIDKIPKEVTKEEIQSLCEKFGDIEEVRLIKRYEIPINYAFINYYESESADKCASQGLIETMSGIELEVFYAKPKFSDFKLKKIDPLLREYLVSVKEGLIPYNPKDFIFLHDASKTQTDGLMDLTDILEEYLKSKNNEEESNDKKKQGTSIQFNLNFNNNNFQQNIYQNFVDVNPKKQNEFASGVNKMQQNDFASGVNQKQQNDVASGVNKIQQNDFAPGVNQKQQNDFAPGVNQKKQNDFLSGVNQMQQFDCNFDRNNQQQMIPIKPQFYMQNNGNQGTNQQIYATKQNPHAHQKFSNYTNHAKPYYNTANYPQYSYEKHQHPSNGLTQNQHQSYNKNHLSESTSLNQQNNYNYSGHYNGYCYPDQNGYRNHKETWQNSRDTNPQTNTVSYQNLNQNPQNNYNTNQYYQNYNENPNNLPNQNYEGQNVKSQFNYKQGYYYDDAQNSNYHANYNDQQYLHNPNTQNYSYEQNRNNKF